MEHILVWPDGTWCYPEELHEMHYMSDDYIKITLSDTEYDYSEDDIANCAYIASYSFGDKQ